MLSSHSVKEWRECGGDMCHQSDGKRALQACIECSILLGANEVLSKAVWHDHISIFSRHTALWIFYTHMICSSATPAKVASWCDHGCNKLFCGTVRNRWIDMILLSARNVVWQRLWHQSAFPLFSLHSSHGNYPCTSYWTFQLQQINRIWVGKIFCWRIIRVFYDLMPRFISGCTCRKCRASFPASIMESMTHWHIRGRWRDRLCTVILVFRVSLLLPHTHSESLARIM